MEKLESSAIACGHALYDELGPGLLQPVYEAVLAKRLEQLDLAVERGKPVPVMFDGEELDEGFRADLLVENRLLIMVQSLEQITPLHLQQITTYLRLMQWPLGLIFNFGAPSFKQGVRRIVNGDLV